MTKICNSVTIAYFKHWIGRQTLIFLIILPPTTNLNLKISSLIIWWGKILSWRQLSKITVCSNQLNRQAKNWVTAIAKTTHARIRTPWRLITKQRSGAGSMMIRLPAMKSWVSERRQPASNQSIAFQKTKIPTWFMSLMTFKAMAESERLSDTNAIALCPVMR